MTEINGFDNEFEFVKYLNGKRVGELNPMFREVIDTIFYCINDDDVIKCWRNHYPQKSDIFIKIRNFIKGISIKMSSRNSVHIDCISEFIHFLIENEVPRDIIIKYLKYHYADGTTNGRSKIRISAEEYKKTHQDHIDEINKYFNNEDLLIKAIDRFIIKGNNSKYYINALVHGTINDFLWLTKDEIIRIILSKKDIYSSAVHFGPLICQPKNRCLNYNPLYEKDRFSVQIKWYSLNDDIIEQMNNKVIEKKELNEKLDEFLNGE